MGVPAFDRATLESELQARMDQLAQARDRYAPDHPDVVRLQRAVEESQKALRTAPTTVAAPRVQTAPDNPAYIQREAMLRGIAGQLAASFKRRDELRAILRDWRTAAVVVTHDFTEAYRLADRIVVYDAGRVVQAAPRSELLWQPASESVARIMGIRNVLHGTVVKATPDRIQLRWRGQLLEAVNSPSRSYLPAPDSSIAFFVRPEYVRLIRKDRGLADQRHHMNLMEGTVVGEEDFGTTWSLHIRLDAPGPPAQGDHDVEVEVPHLVYEILEIDRDRRWQFSIHRGSIHVLPA